MKPEHLGEQTLPGRNKTTQSIASKGTPQRDSTTFSVTAYLNSPLLAVGLGSGDTFLQEFDLAIVIRFVLADVKPLAVIVCRTPSPVLVDGQQPVVIALAEFRQGLFAGLAQ